MSDLESKDPELAQEEAEQVDEVDSPQAEPFEHRSAQAMVATYLQMTRYAELARTLQKARLRATERRIASAQDLGEVERLQRQVEAQQSQGRSIDLALNRFRRHVSNLESFAEVGLTQDDFKILGLDELLGSKGAPTEAQPEPPEGSEERQ